jgi:excisionase family DNA binding protein
MTSDEAAEYARVSRWTILNAARDRSLVGAQLNTRQKWLFRRSDVDNWILSMVPPSGPLPPGRQKATAL